ncbi:MAG TPA: exodeoxyribonuclease VII large subunit [Paludibacteraceae bacterium]|mgnify:CR=1 FL=1|nr:exodeoxyribonuclease VII large subunit [Paludibacteraceae bacterium]HPT42528.1 exodeoxyribonuclease VII large subunit [Paludibacteraceae bacterium]
MNSVSLSELTSHIQGVIRTNFETALWVRAEISELRENNGHCYLELIEKDAGTDNILAKTRANCWANVYRMLKPYFESSTGESLRAGLNVLVAVTVEFSGLYGFSLNIRDIDPSFTIGELAARRLQIIRQLEADGIADMNKQLPFPVLPQRLAIISSATAAGYGDFGDQLKKHPSSFAFYPKLFPAIMQGEQAEKSIVAALERVYENLSMFDVVVIIRGGGATTDLACFDSYNLALNCAQFPIPVIAGIGHQRDISILDMVAHTSVKTPTAAAEFLIDKMQETENELYNLANDIHFFISQFLREEEQLLERKKLQIRQAASAGLLKRKHLNEQLLLRLKTVIKQSILHQKNRIELIQNRIEVHSPAYLFERGYSITTLNGKRLTSVSDVKPGDLVKTWLSDGKFESEVKES